MLSVKSLYLQDRQQKIKILKHRKLKLITQLNDSDWEEIDEVNINCSIFKSFLYLLMKKRCLIIFFLYIDWRILKLKINLYSKFRGRCFCTINCK